MLKNFFIRIKPSWWSTCLLLLPLLAAVPFEKTLGVIGLGIVWGLGVIAFGLFISDVISLLLCSFVLGLLFLWFQHPFETHLFIPNPHDLTEELIALYIAAITLAIAIQRLRLKTLKLQDKEQKTSNLYQIARSFSTTDSFEGGIDILFSSLAQAGFPLVTLVLDKPDCGDKKLIHPRSSYQPDPDEIKEAESLLQSSNSMRPFLKTSKAHYICSLHGFKEKIGFLIFNEVPDQHPSEDNFRFFEAIVDQLAIGLERELLRERAQGIALMSKTQTLYRTLLNSVSHELKTPLATITGSASALLDPLIQTDSKLSQGLSTEILRASQRLTEVLDKLLDMSRIDSGTLNPKLTLLDVRDIIAMSCQRLDLDNSKHRVSIHCLTDKLKIRVDPVLISQAIHYVLQNAIRYGPLDGLITITIEDLTQELKISIRDQGPGVPVELQEKIFDKFYRAHPEKTGGLGLGLSIAHGFLEVHGGRIGVTNHSDGGAVFSLTIPKGDPGESS